MASYTPAPRFHEFDGLIRGEWKEKCQPRWEAFKESINDSNRSQVRRLALSHWHTWEDMSWIEQNLPKLVELDVSDWQDTLVCGGDIPDGSHYSTDSGGKPMAMLCHGWETWNGMVKFTKLWERLEKLWVRHWGCNRLQDSRYRHFNAGNVVEMRSRREYRDHDGQDVTSVIATCTRLRTLAIRGPSLDPALSRCWRPRQACFEDEGSHAHVCAIVQGLGKAPHTLRTVELYQAEFAPQMVELLQRWTPVKRVSFSFGDVLHRYSSAREPDIPRDDIIDHAAENHPHSADHLFRVHGLYPKETCRLHAKEPSPYVPASDGSLHRELDMDLFPQRRMLDWLRNKAVKSHLDSLAHRIAENGKMLSDEDASLAAYLVIHKDKRPSPRLNQYLHRLGQALSSTDQLSCNDPDMLNDIPISPFSFLDPDPDPYGDARGLDNWFHPHRQPATQHFERLHARFDWTPLWDLDPLVAVTGAGPSFLPTVGIDPANNHDAGANQLVSAIHRAFRALFAAGIPIRLLVGNRPRFPAAAATGLYWGGCTTATPTTTTTTDPNQPRTSWLVHSIDGDDGGGDDQTLAALATELTIHYQPWTAAASAALLHGEARGWQRWWRGAALGFGRLRRLRIRMPAVFDGFDSQALAVLLGGGAKGEEGEGSGEWRVGVFPDVEGFVCREWVRVGGGEVVRFGEREVERAGVVEEEEGSEVEGVGVGVGRGRERVWGEWVKAWEELKVELDEAEVEDEERRIGVAGEVEMGGTVDEVSIAAPQQQLHRRLPTPSRPPVEPITPAQTPPPLPEELEAPPSSKKARQVRKPAPKKQGARKKRTRSESETASAAAPPPKKSRWERELEKLKS